jgi:hypothetical protein
MPSVTRYTFVWVVQQEREIGSHVSTSEFMLRVTEKKILTLFNNSWDSWVNTVSKLLEKLGFHCRQGKRNFSSPHRSDLLWGPL